MERDNDSSAYITTTQALESLYGPVATPSMLKEVDHIHPVYQPFIEAASFVIPRFLRPRRAGCVSEG